MQSYLLKLTMKQIALAALILAAVPAFSQSTDPSSDPSEVVKESVSVNYVMIPFTVLGSKGIPITDLASKEVALYVDGKQVASDLFEKSQNAPVSWTILLDGSGSMGLAGKMEAARAALRTLINHRRAGDDFALYVFDDEEVHQIVAFTEDPTPIERSLDLIKPWGKTAFFDAVATMPDRSELGHNPTRAIILLSDGIDNASHLTRLQLAQKLEGVSVPIYSLGLREPAEVAALARTPVTEELSDIGLLDQISQLTGGKLFLGTKPVQFAEAVSAMERNLRAQYLIGFSPTGKGAVKYRRISLKLAGRVRSVRVRGGYQGTEPPLLTERTGKAKRKA